MDEADYMDQQYRYQSDLQSQQSDDQSRLYAPQLREQVAEAQAAIIAQTNPAKALRIVVEGFRGNMIDENNEMVKIGYPLMNEMGIARISSMLIPFVNDPIRFGNLRGKEVRVMALQIINDITTDIGLNSLSYGIKESSMRDIIIDSCLALIMITLTRSEEQGEKNWLGRVVLENISGGQRQGQRKKDSWYDKYLKL